MDPLDAAIKKGRPIITQDEIKGFFSSNIYFTFLILCLFLFSNSQ
jgi:hypothetical protein